MSFNALYSGEPRHPDETKLRAWRASELWLHPDLPDGIRRALEELLGDADLDGEGFEDRLEYILQEDGRVMALWDLVDGEREGGLRGTDPGSFQGAPLVEPSSTMPPLTAPEPHGRPADAEAPPEPAAGDRFLNLALVWPHSRSVVPDDRVLASGRTYELRVDFSGDASESLLGEHPVPLPEGTLPHTDDDGQGDWLDIAVLSDDFTLSRERHPVFLPLQGGSWVCPCPSQGRHTCEPAHRGRYLYVRITAPSEPGPARLRLLVTHRGNQLQSVSLTASVAARESEGGATIASVDYTLTSGFVDLPALPSRTAAVRVERQADGAITVDVTGQGAPVNTFRLTGHQAAGALRRTREALTGIHLVKKGDRVENRLDVDNGKPDADLIQDLGRLAVLGWDLLMRLAPRRPEREALRRLLGAPADLQICRQEALDLLYPWALVYDIPVDGNESLTPCAGGWGEVRRDETARACPDEESHGFNTLCPFGFWGIRHSIEQPPSLGAGRRLRLWAGRGEGAPGLTVARGEALNQGLMDRHMQAIRSQFAQGEVTECVKRETLRDAFVKATGDCVYFYGHGRRPHPLLEPPSTTVLEIGMGDRITPGNLAAWAEGVALWDLWENVAPLVFLNGCHTVDDGPDSWSSFVDAFTGLSASGVVGTEIPLDQELANEVAERFWALFLAGEGVGPALHRVRMGLLRKGNVLGLAYTAYCSAALRLRTRT